MHRMINNTKGAQLGDRLSEGAYAIGYNSRSRSSSNSDNSVEEEEECCDDIASFDDGCIQESAVHRSVEVRKKSAPMKKSSLPAIRRVASGSVDKREKESASFGS